MRGRTGYSSLPPPDSPQGGDAAADKDDKGDRHDKCGIKNGTSLIRAGNRTNLPGTGFVSDPKSYGGAS